MSKRPEIERYAVRRGRVDPGPVIEEYRSVSSVQALMVFLAERGAKPVMLGEGDLIVEDSDFCGVYTVQSRDEDKELTVLPF